MTDLDAVCRMWRQPTAATCTIMPPMLQMLYSPWELCWCQTAWPASSQTWKC